MLIVLRHAESEWNVPPKRCQGQLDLSLSASGRQAASERGAELLLPAAAHASPLVRARLTAELVLEASAAAAGRPPPPVRTDPRLAEASCGLWEGLLHEEAERRWPAEWAALARDDPAFAFPGGESLAEVRERFSAAMADLDARHRGELALVVAHGGPMRFYLAERLGPRPVVPGGPPRNLEGFLLEDGRLAPVTGSLPPDLAAPTGCRCAGPGGASRAR